MIESMTPGEYTALGVINIRTQMKTMPVSNIVGGYSNGSPFRVYEVYDEKDGILWGRVSSNTGSGRERFVALRVNNNNKAKVEQSDPIEKSPNLASAIDRLTTVLTQIMEQLKKN